MNIAEDIKTFINKKKYIFADFIKIAITALMIWYGLMLVLYLVDARIYNSRSSLAEIIKTFATRWDSYSFAQIAQNGYVKEGTDRYLLVFMPMYPLLVRMFNTLTGVEIWRSALYVSEIFGILSACAFYMLVLDYSDRKKAYFSTVLFLLYPYSFFMFTGMSESTYVFFMLMCVYNIRKKNYIESGLFGFLTALTRLPGISVGILMLYDFVVVFIRFYKAKKNVTVSLNGSGSDIKVKLIDLNDEDTQMLLEIAIAMAITLLGFIVYLVINYVVWENPFQFMIFEKENWSQSFTTPANAIKILIEQYKYRENYAGGFYVGVVMSNVFAYIVSIFGLLWTVKKKRWKDSVYQGFYSVVCLSVTWLLSGARYTLGEYPMFEALGELSEKKYMKNILIAVFGILYVVMGIAYLNNSIY